MMFYAVNGIMMQRFCLSLFGCIRSCYFHFFTVSSITWDINTVIVVVSVIFGYEAALPSVCRNGNKMAAVYQKHTA